MPSNTDVRENTNRLYNGQSFSVDIIFDNHTSEPFTLSEQHVMELVIEENIQEWPFKGYIIYSNVNEAIERNTTSDPFFYRMDGKDEIIVKIKINMENEREERKIELKKEVWEMNLNFIIYDSEDMPSTGTANKAKKLYFIDKNYFKMIETNLEWSSSIAIQTPNIHLKNNYPYINKSLYKETDDKRIIKTGDAIRWLLEIGMRFEDCIDEEKWNTGVSTILYTSPNCNTVAMDLDYLIKNHVADKLDDFCIFKYKNRIEKQYQLVAMSDIFENAGKASDVPGELALETFFFENITPTENSTMPRRAPHKKIDAGELDFEIDLNIHEWNKITDYKFVDTAGRDSALALISKPVYHYNFSRHQFAVDYVRNEIGNIKKEFQDMYVSKLAPAGMGTAIFTLNQTKLDQTSVSPRSIYSGWGNNMEINNRIDIGRNEILKGGVFLNANITFTVNGSPHRTIGKFIAIEREDTSSEIKFDDKILGQWFVTNVQHVWNHNRYVNKITAVKIHFYEDPGIKDDIYGNE